MMRELFWDLGKLRGIDSRVIWMRVKKEALDLVALQMEMFLFRKKNSDSKIKSCLETQK